VIHYLPWMKPRYLPAVNKTGCTITILAKDCSWRRSKMPMTSDSLASNSSWVVPSPMSEVSSPNMMRRRISLPGLSFSTGVGPNITPFRPKALMCLQVFTIPSSNNAVLAEVSAGISPPVLYSLRNFKNGFSQNWTTGCS